ncbi:MAG: hydroxyacylglutathione hydrolase [Burkholderiaceae bacterium]
MDSSRQPLTVVPVNAFKDNYLWLLCRGGDAVVVDPGDAGPVEEALADRGLTLRAILLTHHHADHVGGVRALLASRPSLPVYGPAGEAIAGVTVRLEEGDRVVIGAPALSFDVIDVPGHTRGHIAYFQRRDAGTTTPLLFCGDTLFAAGCGRLFEGTAAQMHASLSKLAALPPSTRVYCAHEYTLSNLRFARAVEPDSAALASRIVDADATRARGEPTIPSTIALERSTNPFLRTAEPPVRAAVERHSPGASSSQVATFAALRQWKDTF